MRGLFITGTDTGVGKTVVTAAVADILRARGHRVHVCKPVATGAEWLDGQWVSEDTRLLAKAEGNLTAFQEITPWSFPDPVAPPVAARQSGQALSLVEIAEAVRQRGEPTVPVLVEGVGGLLCPLTENETVADLACALSLPLVVVTRRSLGTLNHTLLTLEAARTRQLRVAGLIVNETTPPHGLAEETNVEELRKRVSEPILAVIPYQKDRLITPIPELAAVDWLSLMELNRKQTFTKEECRAAWNR